VARVAATASNSPALGSSLILRGRVSLSGNTTGSRPMASSCAAVALAPGSGRMTRTRMPASALPVEEARAGFRPDVGAGTRADPRGLVRAAFGGDLMRLASVGREDHAGKGEPVAVDPRQPRDRRAA